MHHIFPVGKSNMTTLKTKMPWNTIPLAQGLRGSRSDVGVINRIIVFYWLPDVAPHDLKTEDKRIPYLI